MHVALQKSLIYKLLSKTTSIATSTYQFPFLSRCQLTGLMRPSPRGASFLKADGEKSRSKVPQPVQRSTTLTFTVLPLTNTYNVLIAYRASEVGPTHNEQ